MTFRLWRCFYTVAAVENATFHNFILLNFSTVILPKNVTYFDHFYTTFFFYFCDKILRLKHINSIMVVLYQSRYILSLELIIDEFFDRAHYSDQAVKRNIYGPTSPFFVYHHWCDGSDKEWCLNFPPLRRREIYELKSRQIWRKRRRRPHVGSCAEVGQIGPSTTKDCTPIVPGQL